MFRRSRDRFGPLREAVQNSVMSRRKKARPPAAKKPPRRGPLAAALFLLVLVLYANTLGHGFVFDDEALILQNPQVTQFRWGEMFGAAGYRPVRTLTYAVNYALGGGDPFGFHLFNVLLHGLGVALLFALLSRWGTSAPAAAAGAAVFACHPAQTAAVAYISGRKDLLATAFLLGGLLLYTRFREESKPQLLAGSMALFALAVFSKEVAVVFPALLLLAELLVFPESPAASPVSRLISTLRRKPLVWASALLVAGAGTYYILAVSRATRMIGFWGGGATANYATTLKLFAHYLKLTVWPHPLIADYKGEVFPPATGFADPAVLLCGLLLLAYLGVAFWAISRLPRVAFGMFWFLVALLPVLQIIPFHEIAADHFLYLPMAGIAWIVAEAMRRFGPLPAGKPAWGVLAAVLLAFSALTIARNRDWKDARTLWEATLKAAPGSYRANANLGHIYYSDPNLRARAVELTQRAVELDPDDLAALSNLGAMSYMAAQASASRGDPAAAQRQAEQALQILGEALRKNPRDGSVLSNLGNVHKFLGSFWEGRGDASRAQSHRRQAAEYFQAALTRDRREEVKAAWYNFALLYMETKDYAAAANCLAEFLASRPGHPAGNLEMGFCQIQLGRPDQAVPYLETAAAAKDDPVSADKAARMLAAIGR